MNKKYLLLAVIVIALGAGMLLMPEKSVEKQLQPEQLLAAIDDPSRFLSTDDITDRLVKKDPSLLLIDVRPESQFTSFAIPNAINIPLDSLLTPAAMDIMAQKEIDKVFYSNSDVASDQAWILAKRLQLSRMYVMKGGINKWFATIVKAVEPAETEPTEATELYRFRVAASQHFFGNKEKSKSEVNNPEKKKISVTKKPAASSSGGGC